MTQPIRLLSDYDLIQIVVEQLPGWEAAWDELMEHRYRPLLHQIAIRQGYRGIYLPPLYKDPKELISELFSHLRGSEGNWSRLRSYKPLPNISFASWLNSVSTKLAASSHQSKMQKEQAFVSRTELLHELASSSYEVSIGENSPEEQMLLDQLPQFTSLAIALLTRDDWQEIARRRLLGEESWEEISAAMGIAEASLRKRWSRTICPHLKKILTEWEAI